MSDVSNTPLRTRISAGLGALLFLITASALTVAAIMDSSTKPLPTDNASQTACSIDGNIVTEETIAAPEAFTVVDPATAIQSTELQAGTGAMAKNGDCLNMKYYGTLAKEGTLFDENFTKKTLLQFQLGAGQVIPGWDKGLVGLKVGGTRRLIIPFNQAYGAQGQGAIPANADLVFVVKLVSIKK